MMLIIEEATEPSFWLNSTPGMGFFLPGCAEDALFAAVVVIVDDDEEVLDEPFTDWDPGLADSPETGTEEAL
jgi:hypothetical protein